MSSSGSKPTSRERIVDAAVGRFKRQGYQATSLDDIQKDSAALRGSLYFHFGSKEGLALAALDRFFGPVAAALEQGLREPGPSPLSRLFAIFGGIGDQVEKDGFKGGCLLGNLGQEMAGSSPRLRAHMEQLFDSLVAAVARYVDLARARGELAAGLDRAAAARLFVSSFHGALIEMRVYKSRAVYDECMRTLRLLLARPGGGS